MPRRMLGILMPILVTALSASASTSEVRMYFLRGMRGRTTFM